MVNLLVSMSDLSNNLVTYLDSTLGIWYLIILNAFGVIAVVCKILEYQVKNRNTMFVITIIANFCWVLYFALYGNFASGLTCLLGVIRLTIFMQRGNHAWADSILWLYLFLALQTGVAIFTTKNWFDVFAIAAGYLGIFSYFVLNQKKYRLLSFFHMSLWVINSIFNFYFIALLSDSFSTVSCGVAIYRYDIKNKKTANLKKDDNQENCTEN